MTLLMKMIFSNKQHQEQQSQQGCIHETTKRSDANSSSISNKKNNKNKKNSNSNSNSNSKQNTTNETETESDSDSDDHDHDLLHKMKPLLKSMEKKGDFLNTVLEAFRGNEDLLLEKLRPTLPAKWIKAPDQQMMLNYNWCCCCRNDNDNDQRKLNFKSDQIRLGCFYNNNNIDAVRNNVNVEQRSSFSQDSTRNIKRRDLTIINNNSNNNSNSNIQDDDHDHDHEDDDTVISYTIKGAGCSCCGGNERHEFTLLLNPREMKYKLLVQETVTAYCCSSDNIEEVIDEYDFVAYIIQDNNNNKNKN